MAMTIKGLTIEIGADISKFQASMKGVNSSIKNTTRELSQVNRALKFNPGNADLIKQKQTLLKNAIEDTTSKLKALKTEEDALRNTPGFDENSEDARRLQREIIETESKLKHLEGKLANTASVIGTQMQAAGDSIKKVGDKMQTVGKGLTTRVTAPIVATGAASVKAFQTVDAGMDIVVQKTGATGDALNGMKDIVKNIAGRVPADFETIGSAVGEVNTRFHATGDDLEDLSEKFVKFADLNKLDVSNSIDLTQKALSAFGLDVKDAGPLLDQLNAVGQQTGASMDTLLQGLVQNGTAFQQLGLSAQQSAVLMGQMETSGANSETVMQGLRKALKAASKEGIPLDQALGDLQNTIKNGKDGVDGLTAAYDLFGKSGDQIYGAVKNGTLDFSNLGATAKDAGGSIEKTFEETQDPLDKAKTAFNKLKTAGYELGGAILQKAAPAVEKLSDFVGKLSDKWDALSPKQQDMILKVAGIAAAIGPVLMVTGKLTSGVGSVIKVAGRATNAISGAMSGIGPLAKVIGFLTSPIGIAVAAVTALIGVMIYLYNTNEEFRNKIQPIWDQIKNIISAALELIKAVIKTFVDTVSAWWDKWGSLIMSTVQKVFNALEPVISAALKVIEGVIKTFTAIIKGDWRGAWNGLKNVVKNALGLIKAVVIAEIKIISSIMSAAWTAIKTKASGAWKGIKNAVTNAFTAIKSSATNAVNTIKSKMFKAWDAIKDKTSTVFSGIKDKMTKPFKSAWSAIKDAVSKIRNLFPIRLGKLLKGIQLPSISVSGGKAPWGIGGKGQKPSFGLKWKSYKKAYQNPLLFTSPTVLPTANGLKQFGDGNGGELVYGHNELLKDIAAAANPISPEELYRIIVAALTHSDQKIVVSGREFARLVRSVS